ncbi:hypothetical protein Rs2_00031 [Raphanus sativus]|nr:hypothetical protein Rs2_00031 [Raphanus sativus]
MNGWLKLPRRLAFVVDGGSKAFGGEVEAVDFNGSDESSSQLKVTRWWGRLQRAVVLFSGGPDESRSRPCFPALMLSGDGRLIVDVTRGLWAQRMKTRGVVSVAGFWVSADWASCLLVGFSQFVGCDRVLCLWAWLFWV